MNLKYLKEAVYEANMEIPRQKLAIYTFGNVSAIDRTEGVIAIKPSGIPYSKFRYKRMCVLVSDEGRLAFASTTLLSKSTKTMSSTFNSE